MDLVNIARSGIWVGEAMAGASALNIASRRSPGVVPPVVPVGTIPPQGTYPHRPVRVVARAVSGGRIVAQPTEETPGDMPGYALPSPPADGRGLDVAPDVDRADEPATIGAGQDLYDANAALLHTDRRMMESSLDLLA